MAYRYLTRVYLRDTDATGVLFFAEQLRICLEAFESFLEEKGFVLKSLIENGQYLMPIVHTEADYFAPLFAGDALEVALSLGAVGNASFTLNYFLYKGGQKVGSSTAIHVTVDKEMRTKIPLPKPLISLLKEL